MLRFVLLGIIVCVTLGYGSAVPTGRYSYRNREGDLVHVIDTKFHDRRRNFQVAEVDRHKRCRCYCRRKWEESYVCCDCGDTTCFPGNARVTHLNGTTSRVDSLNAGDAIFTARDDGHVTSTIVIGYLDRRRDVISKYHVIETASGARLSLSGNHLVFTANDGKLNDTVSKFARDVKDSDYVVVRRGEKVHVTKVTQTFQQGMQGAFVPLTESGTLLVNDVLTSCYASFPHGVAHVAMAPLRWFPALLQWTPTDGVHPYVSMLKSVGRSILPSDWLFYTPTMDHVTAGKPVQLHRVEHAVNSHNEHGEF